MSAAAGSGDTAAALEGCCGRYNTEFGVPPCNCTGWELGTNTEEFAWCAIMLVGACISVCLHSLQSKREKSQVDQTLAEFAAIRSFREYELKVREEQLKKQSQSQLLDTLGNFFVAATPKTRVVRPTTVLRDDFFDVSPRDSEVASSSSAPQRTEAAAARNDPLSTDVQSTVEKLRSIRRIATHQHQHHHHQQQQQQQQQQAEPTGLSATTALGRQERATSRDASSHLGVDFEGLDSSNNTSSSSSSSSVISRMQSTLRTLRSIQRSATAHLSDSQESGSGTDEEDATTATITAGHEAPRAKGDAHVSGGGQTFAEYIAGMQEDSTDDDDEGEGHALSPEHAQHAEAELAASLAAATPESPASEMDKQQSPPPPKGDFIVGPHGGIISTPRHTLSDIAEFPEVIREDEEEEEEEEEEEGEGDYVDSGSASPQSPMGPRR